jgi:hypothetical protein
MAKMLMAQASMRPLKERSARDEFPRERRKRRMSDTGDPKSAVPAIETKPAVPGAGSGTFSEAVSGALIRISDKGTVTVSRLKRECEQNVNGQQNQPVANDNPVISV